MGCFFLYSMQKQGKKPHTKKRKQRNFKAIVQLYLGIAPFASIRSMHVQEFIAPSSVDVALLNRAVVYWENCDAFSDSDVAEVKALFRGVFGMEPDFQLKGLSVEDALIVFPAEDEEKDATRMYAMRTRESGDVYCAHWVLPFGCTFNMDAPLDVILDGLKMI